MIPSFLYHSIFLGAFVWLMVSFFKLKRENARLKLFVWYLTAPKPSPALTRKVEREITKLERPAEKSKPLNARIRKHLKELSIFFYLLLVSPNIPLLAQQSQQKSYAPMSLETLCQGYNGKNPGAFLRTTLRTLTQQGQTPGDLLKQISANPSSPCTEALDDYLAQLKDDTVPLGDRTGQQALLALGIQAKRPQAIQALEAQLIRGEQSFNWLDTLKDSYPDIYSQALKKWAHTVAQEPEGFSPLLFERYLRDLKTKSLPLSAPDWAPINTLFSRGTTSERMILEEHFLALMNQNPVTWIAQFRTLPPLTQFKLLPYMAKSRGDYMKRELIWISQHHQDPQVKTLAQTLLESQ